MNVDLNLFRRGPILAAGQISFFRSHSRFFCAKASGTHPDFLAIRVRSKASALDVSPDSNRVRFADLGFIYPQLNPFELGWFVLSQIVC